MSKLTLIPTPIDDLSPLNPLTKEVLLKASEDEMSIVIVEDHKPARRRWLNWGLPRETIDKFVMYNEHTRIEQLPKLVEKLNLGYSLFLMSDCGMPAFCDPGVAIVNAAHQLGHELDCTPTDNSIAMALALSGFAHDQFDFLGFPEQKGERRKASLERFLSSKNTTVLMETPYKLPKLVQELKAHLSKYSRGKEILLARGLGMGDSQLIWRGPLNSMAKEVNLKEKIPFVLVCGKSEGSSY